jgi:hypothetical protein
MSDAACLLVSKSTNEHQCTDRTPIGSARCTNETGMQEGILHPNPPPPRAPGKLEARRMPGTHLEVSGERGPANQARPRRRWTPSLLVATLEGVRYGRRPPLLRLATSRARRGERDASPGRRRVEATDRVGESGGGGARTPEVGRRRPGERGPRVETSRVVGFQMDGKMRPR